MLRRKCGLADGCLFGKSCRNILSFDTISRTRWLERVDRALGGLRKIIVCGIVGESLG